MNRFFPRARRRTKCREEEIRWFFQIYGPRRICYKDTSRTFSGSGRGVLSLLFLLFQLLQLGILLSALVCVLVLSLTPSPTPVTVVGSSFHRSKRFDTSMFSGIFFANLNPWWRNLSGFATLNNLNLMDSVSATSTMKTIPHHCLRTALVLNGVTNHQTNFFWPPNLWFFGGERDAGDLIWAPKNSSSSHKTYVTSLNPFLGVDATSFQVSTFAPTSSTTTTTTTTTENPNKVFSPWGGVGNYGTLPPQLPDGQFDPCMGEIPPTTYAEIQGKR